MVRPVIDATGVILHMNLGRASLGQGALDHIRETALAYSDLEFNLDSGERGKPDVHVDLAKTHMFFHAQNYCFLSSLRHCVARRFFLVLHPRSAPPSNHPEKSLPAVYRNQWPVDSIEALPSAGRHNLRAAR